MASFAGKWSATKRELVWGAWTTRWWTRFVWFADNNGWRYCSENGGGGGGGGQWGISCIIYGLLGESVTRLALQIGKRRMPICGKTKRVVELWVCLCDEELKTNCLPGCSFFTTSCLPVSLWRRLIFECECTVHKWSDSVDLGLFCSLLLSLSLCVFLSVWLSVWAWHPLRQIQTA